MFLTQYLKSLGGNFGKVGTTVYRGAVPNASTLEKLQKLGVRTILDLRDGDQTKARLMAQAAGFQWEQVALSDKKAPNFGSIMAALALIERGDIFVHCQGGRHRTGLVIACYRTKYYFSKKDAWDEAEEYGYYSALGHKPLKDWFWDDWHEYGL